jgi:CubicO group peptidase (beta-lactamase class C family)
MQKSLVLLLCLFQVIGSPFDGLTQDLGKHFDLLLEAKLSDESPGGTALVVKEGKVLYRKSFGVADLESGIPMNAEHIFRIGSITKQFTACALMRLAEQGTLSLQDSIIRFIKDYPTHGNAITIEHLLTHTSGIKNITGMPAWTLEVQRKDFTPKALVDFFKDEPLDFVPGSTYRYSNSNYILLGHIIELATGTTYIEYLNQNFFQPLGMVHTSYDNFSAIVNNRAKGYKRKSGQYEHADFLNMTQPFSAGALLSNTHDLYTWYNAVMNNKVISKESLEKAQTPFRLSNGELTNYGYGWELGNIQGSRSVKHGGKINGFVTYSIYLPDEKVFVSILSNCDCTSELETIASKIAAMTIGKPYDWPSIQLNENVLQLYEGVYQSKTKDEQIVSLEDKRLLYYSPKRIKSELTPFAKDKFHIKNTLITIVFSRDKKGEIISFTTQSPEGSSTWFRTDREVTKRQAIKIPENTLNQYVGRYQLGAGYFMIIKEDAKLYGKAPGENQVRQEILPFDNHQFFAKDLDAQIRFNVDGQGKVTSLTIIQNGEKTAAKVD